MHAGGRPKFWQQEKSLLLYRYIVTHAAYTATDQQLAAALGLGDRSVNRYIAWLRQRGYITTTCTQQPLQSKWINTRVITCHVPLPKFTGDKPDGVHEDQEPGEERSHP